METIHIKLETEEVVNSRRRLLYTEMNLLNITKKIEQYRKLRILELRSKSILKIQLTKLLEELKGLGMKLPKAKLEKVEQVKVEVMGKATRSKLERELKEIKEELEKLD